MVIQGSLPLHLAGFFTDSPDALSVFSALRTLRNDFSESGVGLWSASKTVSRVLGVPVYLGDVVESTLLLVTLGMLVLQNYRIKRI